MDDLVQRARDFAATKHGGQTRKYSSEPYVSHLDNVAAILRTHGFDHPTILAAAFLHDTMEDTPTTYQELVSKFGAEVAELVFWMTDHKTGSREEQALESVWRLARAPKEAKLIKLADILDNVPNVSKHNPDLAETFRKEKRQILEAMALIEGKALTDMLLYTEALKVT